MLIAMCADKGSPGVTTSSLALASTWLEPAVVVEADPAGGDLALRLRPGGWPLPEAPTVLSVATAARSDADPQMVGRHAQVLNRRVSVVPGAILREQMTNVGDWGPLADAFARSDPPVFADLGHLHSASHALGIAARADLIVAVARPDTTSVIRLRERATRLATELGALRGAPPRLYALLVTTNRHGDANVKDLGSLLAETPAKPFLVGVGFLALDPPAVRRLDSGEQPDGRLARTNLLRTARAVGEQLATALGAGTAASVGAAAAGGRR